MKINRTILFRIGAVAILIAIAAVMMVIGRGHTVYLDNKTLEYNGQTYETPYQVVVYVDGEQVAKLRNRDRGMATCIGQRFNMTLEITQEKGGPEAYYEISLSLPYNMDGIIINLPAFLADLPEEAYLSEFIAAPEETDAEDVEIETDEFGIGEDLGGDV